MEQLDAKKKAVKKPLKKTTNPFFRFLAFLVTVALVLGAVFLVVNRDIFNLDGLRRWFAYRSIRRSDTGQADSFSYDGGSSSSFASLNGGLLVCANNSIRLYDGSGTVYFNEPVSMENPVVDCTDSAALVYDAGGTNLSLLYGEESYFTLSLEEGGRILSARLNDAGWMTVTTQESGYKGVVTIYNDQQEPVMRVNLSSRFVTDAILSQDCQTVALATAGISDAAYESRLDFYDINHSADDPEPDNTLSLGDQVCLDLRWTDDGIWVLGDSTLSLVSGSGALKCKYVFSGRYLKNFTLDGDGYAVLLLGKYRAGSEAQLVVINTAGEASAALTVNEQIFALSAAGRYIAVLRSGNLEIYTSSLDLYRTLETTQGARQVLQRADGSTMLINANTAHLYVPN
ncbi:hypothetical protein H7U37_00600 [Pseudoflavonifractor phocaeensis]|uniref:DUF5711 family protein n=1 Tax=Pseudoflavonifractor phocaeensis TaxID=1870988 RepID=UPI00195722FA|nr:DUF5711 family protein [Pseudoflavonifractor phocaeensis]MBM6937028.1 hypothetical protein [Pseudoflavonifractor phocaeensis]